jgi:hypothetical protein
MRCINHRNDAIDAKLSPHFVVGEKRLNHRPWNRGPTRFRSGPLQTVRDVSPVSQANQVGPNGTAKAAVHLEQPLASADNHFLIDADLSEYVYDEATCLP